MYQIKYLKYKNKYLKLKALIAGSTCNAAKTFTCYKDDQLKIINDNDELNKESNLDTRANIRKKQLIKEMNDNKEQIGNLNVDNFCTNINWNLDKTKVVEKWVPLKNICKGQYVIGRISLLTDYYTSSNFVTLNHNKWTISLNDLFIYCGLKNINLQKEKFPIRLITDENCGIKSLDDKKGINDINVTSREICQILFQYKASLYQCQEYPHIFFITLKKLDKEILYTDKDEKNQDKKYKLIQVYNPDTQKDDKKLIANNNLFTAINKDKK